MFLFFFDNLYSITIRQFNYVASIRNVFPKFFESCFTYGFIGS